jgi:heterodisulfide reductase subunit C
MVKRGETNGLALEAQKCMLCGKCQLACPRGVSTRNVILQINRVLKTEQT